MAIILSSSGRTLITFYCCLLRFLVTQTDHCTSTYSSQHFFADRQSCVEDWWCSGGLFAILPVRSTTLLWSVRADDDQGDIRTSCSILGTTFPRSSALLGSNWAIQYYHWYAGHQIDTVIITITSLMDVSGPESGQHLRVLVVVWRECRDSVSMVNVRDTCPPSLLLCWSLLARTSSEQTQHGRPVCVPGVGMSVAGKLSSENLLSYTLIHQKHFPKRSTPLSHQSRQHSSSQGKKAYS